MSSVDFFSKSTFSKNSFRNTIRVSKSLDPEAQHFVGPDLGPNCLQKLSTDDTMEIKSNKHSLYIPLRCYL